MNRLKARNAGSRCKEGVSRAVPVLILLFLIVPSSFASPGQTAFDFFNLGIGARQAAMGQAGSAAADDLAGAYLNPAGLAQLCCQEVSFLYSAEIQDIAYQHLGYAAPTVKWGSFGASLFSLDYGQISGYDALGSKTGDVKAWDRMMMLDYGNTVWRRISVGASLHYVQEKLGGDGAQAAILDLGLLDRPWDKGILSGLQMGLALRNMGTQPKFDQKTEALPLTLQTGLAYKTLQDALTVALDFVKVQDEQAGVRLGSELWLKDIIALRAGFNTDYDLGSGLTFGLGIKFRNLQLDYAYANESNLGSTNKVGLTYRFGNLSETYYSRGIQKMNDGKYAEAIMEFDKAVTLDPKEEKALLRIQEAYQKLKEKFSQRGE